MIKPIKPTPGFFPTFPGHGPIRPPTPGPTHCWPIPGATVSFHDRITASKLPAALNTPGLKLKEALSDKQATVSFDDKGTPRGPDGQPLMTVKRGDDTLYVDPNTNQYYVKEDTGALYFRKPDHESVKGPFSLPDNAKFDNAYFTDADTRELTRIAQANSKPPLFPGLPFPGPRKDVFF